MSTTGRQVVAGADEGAPSVRDECKSILEKFMRKEASLTQPSRPTQTSRGAAKRNHGFREAGVLVEKVREMTLTAASLGAHDCDKRVTIPGVPPSEPRQGIQQRRPAFQPEALAGGPAASGTDS